MKERSAPILTYVIAVALPLAGLVLAALRFSEGRRDEAQRLVLASLAGSALYLLLFTALG